VIEDLETEQMKIETNTYVGEINFVMEQVNKKIEQRELIYNELGSYFSKLSSQ